MNDHHLLIAHRPIVIDAREWAWLDEPVTRLPDGELRLNMSLAMWFDYVHGVGDWLMEQGQ